MRKQLLNLNLVIPAIVFMLFIAGCKKETTSKQNLIGTYTGTLYVIDYYAPGVAAANEVYDTSQTIAETLNITSGSSADKVNLQLVNSNLSGTGTVSGNNLTIDQTTVGNYIYTGGGNLNGTAMKAYININLPGSSHPYESQYLFKGTKQ